MIAKLMPMTPRAVVVDGKYDSNSCYTFLCLKKKPTDWIGTGKSFKFCWKITCDLETDVAFLLYKKAPLWSSKSWLAMADSMSS